MGSRRSRFDTVEKAIRILTRDIYYGHQKNGAQERDVQKCASFLAYCVDSPTKRASLTRGNCEESYQRGIRKRGRERIQSIEGERIRPRKAMRLRMNQRPFHREGRDVSEEWSDIGMGRILFGEIRKGIGTNLSRRSKRSIESSSSRGVEKSRGTENFAFLRFFQGEMLRTN